MNRIKNKRYEENKFAELVALVGSCMKYLQKQPNIEDFECFYLANIDNKNFIFLLREKQIGRLEIV